MNSRLALTLAVAGGYVLGRTKKAKLAIGIGSMVLGKKLDLSPRALTARAAELLAANPRLAEVGEQLRGDLKGVGKAATGAIATRRINALADSLHERTLGVRDRIDGLGDMGADVLKGEADDMDGGADTNGDEDDTNGGRSDRSGGASDRNEDGDGVDDGDATAEKAEKAASAPGAKARGTGKTAQKAKAPQKSQAAKAERAEKTRKTGKTARPTGPKGASGAGRAARAATRTAGAGRAKGGGDRG